MDLLYTNAHAGKELDSLEFGALGMAGAAIQTCGTLGSYSATNRSEGRVTTILDSITDVQVMDIERGLDENAYDFT